MRWSTWEGLTPEPAWTMVVMASESRARTLTVCPIPATAPRTSSASVPLSVMTTRTSESVTIHSTCSAELVS